MKVCVCHCLLVLLLLSAPGFTADGDGLRFSEHAVSVDETLVLQRIDFDSHPDARQFQTRLNELLGSRANFAGRYRLSFWGCGTGCQMGVIVRLSDGRVFFPPELVSSLGLCFRADSRLLIMNPLDEDGLADFDEGFPDWLWTSYWVWEDPELLFVQENREPVLESCEF